MTSQGMAFSRLASRPQPSTLLQRSCEMLRASEQTQNNLPTHMFLPCLIGLRAWLVFAILLSPLQSLPASIICYKRAVIFYLGCPGIQKVKLKLEAKHRNGCLSKSVKTCCLLGNQPSTQDDQVHSIQDTTESAHYVLRSTHIIR